MIITALFGHLYKLTRKPLLQLDSTHPILPDCQPAVSSIQFAPAYILSTRHGATPYRSEALSLLSLNLAICKAAYGLIR